MRIGVVVPVLNAQEEVRILLRLLSLEGGIERVLIVDSSIPSGPADTEWHGLSVSWMHIPAGHFNHGATRELARKRISCEVVVFLTQDVIPVPGFLEALIKPITTGQAVASYARQLPHLNAGVIEAFPRLFNYPRESQVRTIYSARKYGVYTFFCSNSCAAYLSSALDEIGGFQATLTNEDYFAVARLLSVGGAIAYVADAKVHHSHKYTIMQEFRRYFDTGYVRAENRWVTRLVGHAEGRGLGFANEFLRTLARTAPQLLPYGALQLAAKWLGYRVGFFSHRMPRRWCRWLSSQRYYWDSVHCRHPRS